MKPCRCKAYPFPHRALGGKCTAESIYREYGLGETQSKAALYLQDRFCFSGCSYLHEWEERHPYGETTAAEQLCECSVDRPDNCPIVEHIIELSHRKERA